MEPLYAALSFAAVALVVIQLARIARERGDSARPQRRTMAALQPTRTATRGDVAVVAKAYGIAVSPETAIYTVAGDIDTTSHAGVTELRIAGVALAAKSVARMREAGFDLASDAEQDDPIDDGALDEADAEQGDDAVPDRYASDDVTRHLELCFADGDDPSRAPAYVLAVDGRRVV